MAHDHDLIREIQGGSHSAMGDLVRKHYSLVYAYVLRYTIDKHIAYDLTQDVFVKVTESIHRYEMRSDFRAWLLTIATNQCRDYFRRAAKRAPTVQGHEVIDALVDQKGSVAHIFERDERRKMVKNALYQLPEQQREALVLRFYHDLPISDIAQVTNTNVSTVKSRLRQGMNKLKKWLGKEADDEPREHGL